MNPEGLFCQESEKPKGFHVYFLKIRLLVLSISVTCMTRLYSPPSTTALSGLARPAASDGMTSTLTDRFVRIRHYGFLSPCNREKLRSIQQQLDVPPVPKVKKKKSYLEICIEKGWDIGICKDCNCQRIITRIIKPATRAPPSMVWQIGNWQRLSAKIFFVDRFTVSLSTIFAISCIIIDQSWGLDVYLLYIIARLSVRFSKINQPPASWKPCKTGIFPHN